MSHMKCRVRESVTTISGCQPRALLSSTARFDPSIVSIIHVLRIIETWSRVRLLSRSNRDIRWSCPMVPSNEIERDRYGSSIPREATGSAVVDVTLAELSLSRVFTEELACLRAARLVYVAGARQLPGISRRGQLVPSVTSPSPRSCREFRREYSSGPGNRVGRNGRGW